MSTATKSKTNTSRFRRLARLVALPIVAAGLVAGTASGASAATLDHVAIGRFTCPGNQMIVKAPTMTSLYGDTENAMWFPVVQRWDGSNWVNYRSIGAFNGVATSSGTSNWAYPSGQPSGGSWAPTVAPGSWYNGTYHPQYYRVVNFVGWTNLSDQFIAGWFGPYVSLYATNSSTYCSF